MHPSRCVWWICSAAAITSFLAGCTSKEPPPEPEPPDVSIPSFEAKNLLVIVIDSLRADHVGAYGYKRPTTPYIDGLAAEGLVFERAYANSSYTLQSVSAILTGRLPTAAGAVGLIEAHPADEVMTLAQQFRAAQYETTLVTNQPMLSERGFTKGFYDVQVASASKPWSGMDVTERALESIDLGEGKPFMVYAHYVEPHRPYDPPAEYKERFGSGSEPASVDLASFEEEYAADRSMDDPAIRALVDRYDAEIRYVDDCVRALVEGIRERQLLKDTMVVITSTHGEEFLEHGYTGHAWTLHQEVIEIPLIVYSPELIPPARAPVSVSQVDLYPTFLRLYGLSEPDYHMNGTPWFSSQSEAYGFNSLEGPEISELVIKERAILRSVTDGRWRYISVVKDTPHSERHETAREYRTIAYEMTEGIREAPAIWDTPSREVLYDLQEDPSETANVAQDHPEKIAELGRYLDEYKSFCEEHGFEPRVVEHREPLDSNGNEEMLESLGYL